MDLLRDALVPATVSDMDDFKELLSPALGEWAATLAVVLLGFIVWLVNKVPGWLSNRRATVHGSPSSERYWRARLTEALAHHDSALPDSESTELASRVTEARVMVEAHEARRRVGIGGTTPLWLLVVVFGLTGSFLIAGAATSKAPMLYLLSAVAVLLMITAEVAALQTASAGKERFNVLVAAGRYGHSALVRQDPWRVLREYDHNRKSFPRKEARKARAAEDKAATTRWTRFERALLGITAYEHDAPTATDDIWSAESVQKRDQRSGGSDTKPRSTDVVRC